MSTGRATGFERGSIKLDSSKPIFYSGQIVTGKVDFVLDFPITLEALYLEASGEAVVEWKEREVSQYNGRVDVKYVTYHGNEYYLKHTQNLTPNAGRFQLPSGPQSLPFTFQIPHTAPSTMTGECGSISYKISAFLIQTNTSKEELSTIFEVVVPIDLNREEEKFKQPTFMEFEEEDAGCSCFCGSGNVVVKITLPVSAYCPGQNIPINIDAQNNSGTEIKKIMFQLVSKDCYRSKQPIAENIPPEKVLATAKSGAIMGKTKRNFTVDLRVPDMIVPDLSNSDIIDFGYFFKAKVMLGGCNDDMEDESEIILGMIPLNNFNDNYTHPMTHSLPDGPVPDPEQPLLYNPVNVEPTNTPYNKINSTYFPTQSVPYQNQNVPYQNQSVPYQNQSVPYQNQSVPYQNQNVPYQNHSVPYSPQSVPYPPQNVPYPEKAPFNDYKIGFQAVNNPPQNVSPYPVGMPQPHQNPSLHINLPPISVTPAPSAPPPSS